MCTHRLLFLKLFHFTEIIIFEMIIALGYSEGHSLNVEVLVSSPL